MAQSTLPLLWNKILVKGGYKVHLVLALLSNIVDKQTRIKAGNINQKLKLFIRGKAISGTLIYKGINQFLNLEIIVGIKKKKIIIIAWAVVITLKEWLSIIKLFLEDINSKRIYIDIAVLKTLAKIL
jgi:hypothetical protein